MGWRERLATTRAGLASAVGPDADCANSAGCRGWSQPQEETAQTAQTACGKTGVVAVPSINEADRARGEAIGATDMRPLSPGRAARPGATAPEAVQRAPAPVDTSPALVERLAHFLSTKPGVSVTNAPGAAAYFRGEALRRLRLPDDLLVQEMLALTDSAGAEKRS